MASRVEVKGLKELGEALRHLGATAPKICYQASGAAARVVKKAAEAKVRSNPSIETGSLLQSIIVKRMPKSQIAPLTAAHIVTPRHRRSRKKTKQKQFNAPHAIFIEYGTVNMSAEPVMGPAIANTTSQSLTVMKEALGRGIAREAKKVAK
jgi:HK97 gp10 family phage protein